MPFRILFVGRQPDLYAPLWRELSTGDEVEVSFSASHTRALRELAETEADVIVLDAGTIRAPAMQLCRALRKAAPNARLILIAEPDTTAGLAYDYYVTHPAAWQRLQGAIQEAIHSERRQVIASGEFILDLNERTLVGPAGEGRLTPKQFSLLRLLMTHANRFVTRPQIMREVWHTDFIEDTRTLDVHVSWLRRIVEPNPTEPRYLRTKRGLGYIFLPSGEYLQSGDAADDTQGDKSEGGQVPKGRTEAS